MALSQPSTLRLETQLESLPSLLGNASPLTLKRRPPSGKWSAHENLAHLARYHEMFLERIQRMLIEEQPHFASYRAEEDPEFASWVGLPTEEVVRRMSALRKDLVNVIRNLSAYELTRSGVHSTLGDMAIPLWVEFFLVHEGHHLYQVMKLVRGGE